MLCQNSMLIIKYNVHTSDGGHAAHVCTEKKRVKRCSLYRVGEHLIYESKYLSVCMSVCLYMCLFVWVSVCLYGCLFVFMCLLCLMHARICRSIRTKLCKVTQSVLLTDISGSGVKPPAGDGGGVTISKRAVAEVATVNYFVLYVILKIIIMPTALHIFCWMNAGIKKITFQVIRVCLWC